MLPVALITAAGSFIILEFQRRGFRPLEAIITGMIFIVVIAFGVQVFYAKPELSPLLSGLFIPKFQGVDSILLGRNFRCDSYAARNLFTFRLNTAPRSRNK